MAVVYYPVSSSVYTRQVVGANLIEQVITTTPDTIFVFTSSLGFTSSLAKAGRAMALCLAYTPVIVGADQAEIPVPYMSDGVTPTTWSVKRLVLRTQTPETATSSFNVESSHGTGSFSASQVGTVNLYSSSYESYTLASSSVVSGDKLRFNITTLGGASYWTIITELTS